MATTVGSPPSGTLTAEFVVPGSIPTARAVSALLVPSAGNRAGNRARCRLSPLPAQNASRPESDAEPGPPRHPGPMPRRAARRAALRDTPGNHAAVHANRGRGTSRGVTVLR
ncbi:hypothetical protein CUT44_32410 [Streptomyces carminius]|uniref:Uncharacterized protein n=1 Tax=Streptomyces carminius TaxID=2665496 RepID=A0A2M8LPK1_9ACTN|nr:hypothetical protein CUT44_32410 [Streptomyces carminius]